MIEGVTRVARKLGSGCVLALAALALTPTAHAENVFLTSGTSIISGTQSLTSELNVTSAGTLTVQVADLGQELTILDRLGSLSFSVANNTGVLSSRAGEGILTVDVTTPGLFFLNISASPNASSRFKMGILSWNAFATPAAVPLPASVWLLIAGLAWAMGMQRKRAKVPPESDRGFLPWPASTAPAH